jgi:hypothetical protein
MKREVVLASSDQRKRTNGTRESRWTWDETPGSRACSHKSAQPLAPLSAACRHSLAAGPPSRPKGHGDPYRREEKDEESVCVLVSVDGGVLGNERHTPAGARPRSLHTLDGLEWLFWSHPRKNGATVSNEKVVVEMVHL